MTENTSIVPAQTQIPELSRNGFGVTPTGLAVSGEPTLDQWLEFGKGIKRVEGCVQWVIGDWLNEGEKRYGETYAQALALWPETEYDHLAQYKWVAGAVEFCTRVQNLSWTHHRLVASLAPYEQKKWLARAEKEGWSVGSLRIAIAKSRRGVSPAHAVPKSWEQAPEVLESVALIANMKDVYTRISLNKEKWPDGSKALERLQKALINSLGQLKTELNIVKAAEVAKK